MRLLMLFRGAPGCGKSTFIKDMGWEPYVISPDNLRMMYDSLSMQPDGSVGISQKKDAKVWGFVYQLLEQRMSNGLFTVVDSTNSKTEEMSRLKNLASKYKYRVALIDMTSIPKETVIMRNMERQPSYKAVPLDVIDRQYARFQTEKIPSGITVIPFTDPQETRYKVREMMQVTPICLDQYRRIVHVGDIHGCATVLKEAIPEIDPDTMYIFCGDYLDRGLENAEVANMLLDWYELPNVMLLEGNHEKWLERYGTNREITSKEFLYHTEPQLAKAGVSAGKLHKLYRRCAQMAYYTFHGNLVMVSHGGIPVLIGDQRYPTRDLIHGIGKYEDIGAVMETFNNRYGNSKVYQVCGHRNPANLPVQNGNCWLLEGGVERGGYLRTVVLDEIGWCSYLYQNTVYDQRWTVGAEEVQSVESDEAMILKAMQQNPDIVERKFGNISSLNFSRDAFYKGHWDNMTVRARGLFFNNETYEVVARGYDKFFAIEERPETRISVLTETLKFPVEVYQKENGFLGIAAYDKENDAVMYLTKGNKGGEYAQTFEKIFKETGCNENYLKVLVKSGHSVLFEVVDPVHDPHIIKYDNPTVFLLDVVENKLNDAKFVGYTELEAMAQELGCPCKQRVATLVDKAAWLSFVSALDGAMVTPNGEFFEGFVLQDAAGMRLKYKTDYYRTWKSLREVARKVKRYGRLTSSRSLYKPIMIHFYHWVKKYYEEHPESEASIIDLRDMFEKEVQYEG